MVKHVDFQFHQGLSCNHGDSINKLLILPFNSIKDYPEDWRYYYSHSDTINFQFHQGLSDDDRSCPH